jgi:hypothetical protein
MRRQETNDENHAVGSRTTRDDEMSPSRRRFAKTLAAAVLAAPAAVAANAQTPPATSEPKAPPQPQPTPGQQTQGPPPPSPLALAYAEVARQRFAERLKTEQFEAVKRDLEGNVRTAERLRASKLKNSDEPDFTFSA